MASYVGLAMTAARGFPPLKVFAHHDVLDARLHEHVAFFPVAVAGIEGFHVGLGVERNAAVALVPRMLFEEAQHTAADAMPPPAGIYGHATDEHEAGGVPEDAAGPDDYALAQRDCVGGRVVVLVVLLILRHALLLDEHAMSECPDSSDLLRSDGLFYLNEGGVYHCSHAVGAGLKPAPTTFCTTKALEKGFTGP